MITHQVCQCQPVFTHIAHALYVSVHVAEAHELLQHLLPSASSKPISCWSGTVP